MIRRPQRKRPCRERDWRRLPLLPPPAGLYEDA